MTQPKTENPPAFPCTRETTTGKFYPEGMTLRDYFAGQVLPSAISNGVLVGKDISYEHGHVAHCCYKYADAMLAERLKE